MPADDFAHPFVRVAPQGQVILNPHPDFDAPSPSRLALEALEPAAGADPTLGLDGTAVAGAKDCPVGGGWQVVVIRGGRSPDVVRGPTVAAVTPPGC
ncbi:MAG: hypothetical protein R3F55_11915 [Alphaproteobacteria bacterium]